MPRTENPSSNLSAVDVARLMRELEEMHYGNTVIELRVVPPRNGGNFTRLVVVAANFVGVHRTNKNTRAAVQVSFPSNRHKTFAGACMGALYEMSAELDKLREAARGAAEPLMQIE